MSNCFESVENAIREMGRIRLHNDLLIECGETIENCISAMVDLGATDNLSELIDAKNTLRKLNAYIGLKDNVNFSDLVLDRKHVYCEWCFIDSNQDDSKKTIVNCAKHGRVIGFYSENKPDTRPCPPGA